MNNLRELVKKINIKGKICFAEPMASHTTFRIGGPADIFIRPADIPDLMILHRFCKQEQIPVFLLGGGANILVADAGLRGIVISLQGLNHISREGSFIRAEAGAAISDLSLMAAEEGLSGLEFIYSMPGSIGGSVYMNARCYGISVSNICKNAEVIDADSRLRQIPLSPELFGYKHSPFQKNSQWIVSGCFRVAPGNPEKIRQAMETKKRDREKKGHFLYPCAGSVFKNNRDFGKPSGALIDSLGLKGYSIGGARISEKHANIIVNTGNATAVDVVQLIRYIQDRVREAYGHTLDPELILVGAWEKSL